MKAGKMIFLMFAPLVSMAATIDIAADAEHELTSTENAVGNVLSVAGNATLKLTGSVTDGMFTLNPAITFTGAGTLTVDISALTGCTAIRMVNHVRDAAANGQGVIAFPAEIGQVVFGSTSKAGDGALNNSSNPRGFPAFEADVTFAEAGGVLAFTNAVSLVKLPVTGNYTIREGSRIALFGKEVLGSGDFTMTNYDVQICGLNCFSEGATVTVPNGRTLYIRPAKLADATSYWNGQTWTVTNNIVLGGPNAAVRFQNNNDPGFCGTVSGEGKMIYGGNGSVKFSGRLDFTGTFSLGNSSAAQGHELRLPDGATVTPKVQFASGGWNVTCKIRPDGWSEGPTSMTIPVLESAAEARQIIDIGREATVTVGELSGVFSMSSSDPARSATLVVTNLKSSARLYVKSGLNLVVKAFEEGAQVLLETNDVGGASWTISGPTTGSVLTPPLMFPEDVSGMSITLGGKLRLPDVLPVDALTILPGADVEANFAAGTRVINNGGTLTPIARTWCDKVTLWTDATDASTFTYAKDDTVAAAGASASIFNDTMISEWRDCRPDHQGEGALRLRMTAFDKASSTPASGNVGAFPDVETVDGKTAVRMKPIRGRLMPATGPNAATTVSVKYAAMVFNGVYGGGNALLSTENGRLKRVSNVDSVTATVNSPLILGNSANVAFRTNGVDVAEPTVTPLSGGWQLITFTCDSLTVNNLGHASSASTGSGNGGQVYGEVLLFTELPTEEEQNAIETYLAQKWELPLGHEPAVEAPVDLTMFGNGTVELARSVNLTNGLFSGTVDLNGYRMTLSTNALPFTEATVPAADRALWIDPSLSGAVVLGDDTEKPTEVAYIYSRDNTGLLTADGNPYVSSPIGENGGTDRRVRVVSGARANGTAATWLEFTDGYGNDNAGNHLLVAESLPARIPSTYADKGIFTTLAAKSAFFVLDTTKGGGTVVATTANGTDGSFRSRFSDTLSKQIWPSANAEDVKNAPTYLDGVQVNGATDTFSLRPEVLSFTLPEESTAEIKVFGYSGTPATAKPTNDEIMGEWLLYTTPQTEDVRKGIEAYLMWKWLGKLRDGFSDFRGMTVTGAGTLAMPNPDYLPTLDAGFAGTLAFLQTTWSFTLPTDGSAAAVDAVELPGRTVALPATVTINLDVTGAAPGDYRLMTVGAFAGDTVFTAGSIAGLGRRQLQFVSGATGLSVRLLPKGTSILIR